jgi:hypothetical protein
MAAKAVQKNSPARREEIEDGGVQKKREKESPKSGSLSRTLFGHSAIKIAKTISSEQLAIIHSNTPGPR